MVASSFWGSGFTAWVADDDMAMVLGIDWKELLLLQIWIWSHLQTVERV